MPVRIPEDSAFAEPEEIVPGLPVTFFPAGHILGAASVGLASSDDRKSS
jgi:Cft2 family RNA processing exonuclease